MFAKIFLQIFESSIAEDHVVRHVFMDLLVLADREGIVDKTHEAIARITNVPLEAVQRSIRELESADPKSRSDHENGCRLKRLDEHRDWGWRIVNYEAYREIRDDEARRQYFRQKKREYRARESKTVQDSPILSSDVQPGPAMSTHAEADAEADAEAEKKSREETEFILNNTTKEQTKSIGRSLDRQPKDWQEFFEYAAKKGCSKEEATYFYTTWKANGWTTNKAPIKDWRAKVVSWHTQGYFNKQKL